MFHFFFLDKIFPQGGVYHLSIYLDKIGRSERSKDFMVFYIEIIAELL